MAVPAHAPRMKQHTTDGVSNSYVVDFPFWELLVYIDGVSTTAYTVTGGNGSTGSIAFTSLQTAGKSVIILGDTTAENELDLTGAGTLEPESIEDAIDRLTMKVQELEDRLSKSVRVPLYADDIDSVGDPADHDGEILGSSNGVLGWLTTVDAGVDNAVIATLGDLAFLDTAGAAHIDNSAVTYAKIQNVSATSRVLGRKTSGSGVVEELTGSDVLAVIDSTVNGWTGQQYFETATLTDAANIAWNLDTQQVATVTLAGNRTLSAPTNMKNGATYILIVKQDAVGGRTLNVSNSTYKFPGGTEPTLSAAANAVDIFTFVSDGTSMFGVAQKAFS